MHILYRDFRTKSAALAMKAARSITAILAFAALVFTCAMSAAFAAENGVAKVEVKKTDRIIVDASLVIDPEQESDLKQGVSKEYIFYVDLFKSWDNWPDEFVLGRKIERTLLCDAVKKEYVARSSEYMTSAPSKEELTEKRFSDCEGLIKWALSVEGLRLTTTSTLEPGIYYVKVTAESRIRHLPPVINYLFFFVREREFKVSLDSRTFDVEGEGPP